MFINNFKIFLLCTIILTNSAFAATTKNEISTSTSNYTQKVADFYELKQVKNFTLLKIKGYQQSEDYTCGPAAVMSLMHYYGMLKDNQMNKNTEMRIANEMGTNSKNGTSPQQMLKWLDHHGLHAELNEHGTIDLLQNNLSKGVPTLVEWIDWGGHWTVVAGYNKVGNGYLEDKDTLFLADPSARFNNMKFLNGLTLFNPDRFMAMWFDAQYFKPGQLVKGIYIVALPYRGQNLMRLQKT